MVTTLVHPWASRRLSLGITQEALASRLNVSRHFIIRLEQGLFSRPPPLLLRKIAKIYTESNNEIKLGLAIAKLQEEYDEYVLNTRKEFGRQHASIKDTLRKNYNLPDKHPLVFYRESLGLSRIGFCKGLCLHQDGIRDYELNKQKGLPEQLKEALDVISWDAIELEQVTQEWRIKWH